MRVMVCGSRDLKDLGNVDSVQKQVNEILDEEIGFLKFVPGGVRKVLHGGARGVDEAAGKWGIENLGEENVSVFEPDYDNDDLNKPAPLARNDEMIAKSDMVIAIWDGNSNGTKYVINRVDDSRLSLHDLSNSSLDDFF